MPVARSSRLAIVGFAVAFAFAVASTISPVTAPPAHADPIVWPEVSFYVDPSYATLSGTTTVSETPLISFTAYDEEAETYPEYEFDAKLEKGDPAAVVTDIQIEAVRDGTLSWADWQIESGDLQVGETYFLSVRLTSGSEEGDWSLPSRVHVGELVAPPGLVSPAEDALVRSDVVLTVDAGEPDADVAFRVETGWEDEDPTEVVSGSATSDSLGIASFDPELPMEWYDEGSFRWQVLLQGDGYSEWSDFYEFSVGATPTVPFQATAVQFDESGNRHNRIDVSFGNSGFFTLAPITEYVIDLEPGGEIVKECYFPPPTWRCTASFEGLSIGEYEVSVYARNALGDGPAAVIPVDLLSYVPSAPQDVTADVVLTTATVTWAAPEDLGEGVFDHYFVALAPITCEDDYIEFSTTDTEHVFEDLVEGCRYEAILRAFTDGGGGEFAFSDFWAYGLPAAPTATELRVGDGFLEVLWDDAYNNGSPIESYTVTVSPGDEEIEVLANAEWFRQKTHVDGLENGVSYSFSITATNAAGTGPAVTTDSLTPVAEVDDADSDGLPDAMETRIGTSSLLADTDADGIDDVDEVNELSGFTDPLLQDTDDDSVIDGLDDSDADTVSNEDEIATGTNPVLSDTDDDGFADADEALAGTEPTSADSDGDLLLDGVEIAAGSDPLMDDSDSDSILDGDEAAARTISSSDENIPATVREVEARLSGSARGVQFATLEVAPASSFPGALTASAVITDSRPKIMGPAPELEVESLVLTYPGWAANQLANLAPVAWNSDEGTWEFVDNDVTVTTATHTITIDSPILGLRYAVVDLDEWRGNANQCSAAMGGHPRLDVEVIFDVTESVAANDPTGERFAALSTVLDSLHAGDRVTIRQYGYEGIIASSLGSKGGPPGNNANGYFPYNRMIESTKDAGSVVLTPAEAVAAVETMSQRVAEDMLYDEYLASAETNEMAIGGAIELTRDFTAAGAFTEDELKCRVHTRLLVTDGGLEPLESATGTGFPENYTVFREQDIPTHVLDVGAESPSAAVWLEDLADSTGGSYSFVPTASDLVFWISEVVPWTWEEPSSYTTDTDDDGIPDNVEILGVVATSHRADKGGPPRFTSDPEDSDTDNDGVPDGSELGLQPSAAALGVSVTSNPFAYWANSNPRFPDSDFDGLPDVDEIDAVVYNALARDQDFDSVDDDEEYLWGTVPFSSDSDGDRFPDRLEIDEYDYGLNPVVWTDHVSPNAWLEDFAVGLIGGEYQPRDRIGWLIGSLVSGFLAYGDVRDAIFFAEHRNWISFSFTALGIIPIGGDIVKAVNSIVRFISRSSSPRNVNAAVTLAAGITANSSIELLRLVDEVGPDIVDPLIAANVRTSSIRFLLSKPSMTMEHLRSLLDEPAPPAGLQLAPTKPVSINNPIISGNNLTPKQIGDLGELYVAKTRGLVPTSQLQPPAQVMTPTPGGSRWYDLVEELGGGVDRYIEVKTGYAKLNPTTAQQIARDATMIADDKQVVWVFVASGRTGIGPDPALLQALKENNIPFEIHWPH